MTLESVPVLYVVCDRGWVVHMYVTFRCFLLAVHMGAASRSMMSPLSFSGQSRASR